MEENMTRTERHLRAWPCGCRAYRRIDIFNDRVEGYGCVSPVWCRKGTIPVENIAAVHAQGTQLIVEGHDGQVFKVGGHPRHEVAQAKELIESRMRACNQTPDPFGER
jgi:hypothetical protein